MATLGDALRTRIGRFVGGRNPTPRPRPYREMGVSGTAVWGGYVQVKERSPEWVGRQKWVTASELAINTSIVAASVHYFLNLVAYPNWTFRAHDEDDEESLALAEFAENVFNDMDTPWYKVVRRAAMYRFHGFGLQEWTAKHRKDGLIGFKDIEARPQHTIEQWDVDIDGSVLGVWQRSPQTGHMLGLPRDKLLYLVEDTLTDNPEGIGMFRHIADPYKRLKVLQELEIRAYERDLRGTPIARAPLTLLNQAVASKVITEADARGIVSAFEGLVKTQVKQSDTGLVMDSMPYFSDSDSGDVVSGVPQWGFELLQGSGVGHAEIAAAIDRVQREIARIIGTEHLMMGDVGGNRSLAEDKSRNLYLIANSVLKYIAAQVKGDLLVPLWRLNGFPMDKMPEPKPEDVTFKNVDAITNAIAKLASAGAPLAPNDPIINDVRDLLGVTRVPDDVMAAGAMPMNPMLAGLPPELQQMMGGGKGGPPKGLNGAGGPGKLPGMGGGGMPGTGGQDPTKKIAKRPQLDVEEDEEERDEILGVDADGVELDIEQERAAVRRTPGGPEEAASEGRTNGRGDPQAVGGESEQRQAKDLIESKEGGGKVEVDTGLLVRLLERFAAGSGGEAQKPTEAGADAKPVGKPALGQSKPAKDEPGGDTGSAAVGRADKPEVKPAGQASEEDLAATQAGKPGAQGAPAAGKDPMATGKPTPASPQAATEAKPGQGAVDPTKPGGQPAQAQAGIPGQPPQVGPDGQPLPPGAPPAEEPEMTPERASEILQPYADGEPAEEEEPRTESDLLWTRLGEEKDVQAAVSDQDPMAVLDGKLGKPEPDERTERFVDNGDEEGADPAEDETRARLRERLNAKPTKGEEEPEEDAPKPKPKKKPGNIKRVRL